MRTKLARAVRRTQGQTTDWYLNSESSELKLRREPEITITVTQELMDWIETVAKERWKPEFR